MRQRDARVRRRGNRRRNARHDLVCDSGRAQRLSFLAAAPKYERIASLESNDAAFSARFLDQQCVDVRLSQSVTLRLLADVNPFARLRRECNDRLRCEVIVE